MSIRSNMKGVVIATLAMLAMVQYMAHPSEALVCADIDNLLLPCLSFLRSGGTPAPGCCTGLRTLQVLLLTRADRQLACNCCKQAAIRLQINKGFASQLPAKCGVSISIQIAPDVDCSLITLNDDSYKKGKLGYIGSALE